MKYHQWLFKILREKTIMEARTHNVKTVYHPLTQFVGGIINSIKHKHICKIPYAMEDEALTSPRYSFITEKCSILRWSLP